MTSNFAFDQEYELSELVLIIGEKIEASDVSLDTYISTDNMLVNRGGVESAVKLPSVPRFNSFKVQDTLFSNIRTYFKKVWLANFSGGASADVLIFRTKNSEILDPIYLYFLLSNDDFINYTVLTSKGAKMPRGDKAAIMQYKFKIPHIKIQRKIGSDLLKIDKKIQLNRQTNQTLEHIAQAIFKSWFVDFEPTRAKIAARQAYHNLTPAEKTGVSEQHYIEHAAICAISGKTPEQLDELNPETQQQLKTTAALFPNALVESELGEVPEGWAIKSLSKMIELIGGGTPKRSEESYWGGDIPWFSVKDAPAYGDVFVIDTDEKITELGLNNSSTKLLPEGVTIISARGTVGRLALVGVPVAMNQSCYGVKAGEGLGPAFNYFNLKQAVTTLKQRTHGAVFDTITTTTFEAVYAVEPCENCVNKYEGIIAPLLEKIKSNLLEVAVLEECRDSLLPKLLSGEINIDDAQTTAEVVA